MTAVVGILNKTAVAIAADSAVTLHNGKIFNKANKIFTLSKYHPVGIMIHNVDSLMGTPWETIIKLYRQQLRDKPFDTLEEYQKDFVDFLRKQNFFCSKEQQDDYLNLFFIEINNYFKQEIDKTLSRGEDDYFSRFLIQLRTKAEEHIAYFSGIKQTLPDFIGYSFDEFDRYIEPKIQEVFDYSFAKEGYLLDDTIRTLLKKVYFNKLIVKEYRTTDYSGLVFAGFGQKEIFPSLISLYIYQGLDNRLRYCVNSNKGATITHDHPGAICTFAQSDVMRTILTGISPALKKACNFAFKDALNNYHDLLLNRTIDKDNLKFLFDRNKDKIINNFTNVIDDAIQKNYLQPLHEAIAGLSKEDLGEMAESLIYLTYLQRRITNAEESVGGPVDAAILSKGEGFIWIKRKHYFKPELNLQFLKNYFI